MPSFLISLVCMICIYLSLVAMTMNIHDDLSAFLGVNSLNSNQLLQMLPAPGSFSLNTNEAPTKTRSDI